jgi:hypothetical protein
MSSIRIPISPEMLRIILRLPESTRITGTDLTTAADGCTWINLTAEDEHAPAGAATATPVYQHHGDWPDPIILTGINWNDADGNKLLAALPY